MGTLGTGSSKYHQFHDKIDSESNRVRSKGERQDRKKYYLEILQLPIIIIVVIIIYCFVYSKCLNKIELVIFIIYTTVNH